MNICRAPGVLVSLISILSLFRVLVVKQSGLDSPRKKKTNTMSKASPQATLNQDVDRYCSIGKLENNTPTPENC